MQNENLTKKNLELQNSTNGQINQYKKKENDLKYLAHNF